MKIHKKLGLCLMPLATTAMAALLFPPNAFASPITDNDFANFPYKVSGFSNHKVDTLTVTIGGKDYFFVDTNTNDDTDRLEFYGNGSPLCHMEKGQGPPMYGIKITGDPIQDRNGKDYFPASIGIGYSGDTTLPCNKDGAQHFITNVNIQIFYSPSLPGAPTPSTICSAGSTDPKCAPTPSGGGGGTGSNTGGGGGTGGNTGGGGGTGGGGLPVGNFEIINPLKASTTTGILTAVGDFIFTIGFALVTVMVLWAGFQILTAAGNPSQIDAGKRTLLWAVLGTVVILIAGGIAKLIENILGGGPA